MTFFNTLYFLNDEISSFSFFLFESPPPVTHTTILVLTKSMHYQVYKFWYTYCGHFRIHLAVIMYHSLRLDLDTHLTLAFSNLTRFSSRACIHHPWCLPLSNCYKIISRLEIRFHSIFANYPCTHLVKHLSTTPDKIC